MRLHRLDITAFGPFADTVTIDFDELSEAGLFLLSGPTGAGKTSVLDAVCFALYGDVPGDRGTGSRLRCDTAADGVAPRVVLETTLTDRRFRITRSPAWERPKKRGTGTTMEQAKVLVEERRDATWIHHSGRNDEAGQLVAVLLGMNMSQFCQVAMLPQGQFQAFLRARSEERQRLLQKLFRTDRFADVERWLRDRRVELRRGCEDQRTAVVGVLGRISESAGEPCPEAWEDGLEEADEAGELAGWAGAALIEAVTARGETVAALDRAVPAEQQARQALEEGRRCGELQARHARARVTLTELDARADAVTEARRRLDRARRAAPVRALLGLAGQAVTTRDRVAHRAGTARAEAAALLGVLDVDPPLLESACERARDRLADTRSLLPREAELQDARAEACRTSGRMALLTTEQTALSALVKTLPDRVAEARAQLDEARAAEARIPTLQSQVDELGRRGDALERLASLDRELETARAGLAVSVDESQTLKEAWLNLREARLEGMAAEIAGRLAVGDDCPVCGSVEHPQRAVAAPGAPSERDEKQARRGLDDAEAVQLLHDLRVRDLQTQAATARAAAGPDPADRVGALLDVARGELSTASAAAAGIPTRTTRLQVLESELEAAHRRHAALDSEVAGVRATGAGLDREVTKLAAELAAVLSGTDHDSLAGLVRELESAGELLAAALTALTDLERAEARLSETAQSVTSCAREHGFDDGAAAESALLDEDDCSTLQRSTEDHARQRAAALALLDDPELRRAADGEAPDTGALAAGHAAAADVLASLQGSAAVSEARAGRLRSLGADLDHALAAWAPARTSYAVAERLASFVEGKSADNRLKMRLSAYVLSYRLDQVVSAANVRLATMSDQRYSLEHTHHKGAGETRGGLSLMVRDAWSGAPRDPVTLSGGETFIVSLALALGLADVVTQETGGADLGTLFVDEGFGSLDAETLDDVMDTLDDLRDGGRVVGVVSHVAEMRDRITTRLQVDKDRRGSRVRLEHSAV